MIGLNKVRAVAGHHKAAKRDVRQTAGGEEPDPDEYERRFGLGGSSEPKTAVVQVADPDRMPQPGDAVAGFVLNSAAGRSTGCSSPGRPTWPTGRWC